MARESREPPRYGRWVAVSAERRAIASRTAASEFAPSRRVRGPRTRPATPRARRAVARAMTVFRAVPQRRSAYSRAPAARRLRATASDPAKGAARHLWRLSRPGPSEALVAICRGDRAFRPATGGGRLKNPEGPPPRDGNGVGGRPGERREERATRRLSLTSLLESVRCSRRHVSIVPANRRHRGSRRSACCPRPAECDPALLRNGLVLRIPDRAVV